MKKDEMRTARKKLGLTQEMLAKKLGLSGSRVVRSYELGEKRPGGPVVKLMEIFLRELEEK